MLKNKKTGSIFHFFFGYLLKFSQIEWNDWTIGSFMAWPKYTNLAKYKIDKIFTILSHIFQNLVDICFSWQLTEVSRHLSRDHESRYKRETFQ